MSLRCTNRLSQSHIFSQHKEMPSSFNIYKIDMCSDGLIPFIYLYNEYLFVSAVVSTFILFSGYPFAKRNNNFNAYIPYLRSRDLILQMLPDK